MRQTDFGVKSDPLMGEYKELLKWCKPNSCHEIQSIIKLTFCVGSRVDKLLDQYTPITWTNKMHNFLLIYFNSQPPHVSSRLAAHHQEDHLCKNSNWYNHALRCLYKLLFLQIWSSWWWLASLHETCRCLLLK
jgi:hypothetical protein